MRKVIGIMYCVFMVIVCITYAKQYPLRRDAVQHEILGSLPKSEALLDSWQDKGIWVGLAEGEAYEYRLFIVTKMFLFPRYRVKIDDINGSLHMEAESYRFRYDIRWEEDRLTVEHTGYLPDRMIRMLLIFINTISFLRIYGRKEKEQAEQKEKAP